MDRRGSAEWRGSLKEGGGTLSSESGVLTNVNYSFAKRFGDEKGTNPEELLAAAHAACFTMAASGQFTEMGFNVEYIRTAATVRIEKLDAGFAITRVHLSARVKAARLDQASFETAMNNAKAGCPVSKLFKGAEISMDAQMES
jgi:osmotically inducible protein OsmC